MSFATSLSQENAVGKIRTEEKLMSNSDFSAVIPSLASGTDDFELDRLLSPARHYRHPDEVLADRALDPGEKRAILSSWASDACAVESLPALRRPPGARTPIPFDVIMDALLCLDGLGSPDGGNHISRSRPEHQAGCLAR